MLKTIDVLLGVTVVMLVVSMAVTVLTGIVTSLLNRKGKHLMAGLADLLQQIDPAIERAIAEKIASAVLLHPLVQNASGRLGVAIHREEFTKLLMELSAGHVPPELAAKLDATAKKALDDALQKNGISDPAKILDNVRSVAVHLELSNPELSASVRHAMALMHEANSKLVAKVNDWFDQTIDRVADRFNFTTRGITFACSILVAFTLQLDTVGLINRLSVDSTLRESLVKEAIGIGSREAPNPNPTLKLTDEQKADLSKLADVGLVRLPGNFGKWRKAWGTVSFFGVLLSAMLLSLGAPFWYNALRNLLKMRSVIAAKDDVQRETRQTTQTTTPADSGPAAAPPAAALSGERGILG